MKVLKFLIVLVGLIAWSGNLWAQSSHPAITDPSGFDPAYPPAIEELSSQVDGSKVNGHIYMAAGEGPHPTIIMLHGYAGNEKNLDLTQALRRAGYNTLFFHYRGAWGSGGDFRVPNSLGDIDHIISKFQDPEWAKGRRVDGTKICIIGHSFGGFLGALATSQNEAVSCFTFIAGYNGGMTAEALTKDPSKLEDFAKGFGVDMNQEGGPIHGDPKEFLKDYIGNADFYNINNRAFELSSRALLVIGGLQDQAVPFEDHHVPFVRALKAAGAKNLTELVIDDGHSFNANRINLSIKIIDWFGSKCWP